MPSHQERVRRNNCEHEWVTKPYAFNFLVCKKCEAWLGEDGETIFYGKIANVKINTPRD